MVGNHLSDIWNQKSIRQRESNTIEIFTETEWSVLQVYHIAALPPTWLQCNRWCIHRHTHVQSLQEKNMEKIGKNKIM